MDGKGLKMLKKVKKEMLNLVRTIAIYGELGM